MKLNGKIGANKKMLPNKLDANNRSANISPFNRPNITLTETHMKIKRLLQRTFAADTPIKHKCAKTVKRRRHWQWTLQKLFKTLYTFGTKKASQVFLGLFSTISRIFRLLTCAIICFSFFFMGFA